MKLSEAILLGSVGTEQACGSLMTRDGKTCALGAALVATGYQFSGKDRDDLLGYMTVEQQWPWARNPVEHPVRHTFGQDAIDIIWSLNDNYGWTRPQIAAWVASIEPQDEQVKVQNGGLVEEEVQLR